MSETLNDNFRSGDTTGTGPDAHGHAAMLLVESLIHGLVASSAISITEAVEIVDIAADVNLGLVAGQNSAPENLSKSLTLLESISKSLSRDLPDR